jgi:hypothetical protein
MFNVMASFAMKIALLHPTFWPQPGGVEHVMRLKGRSSLALMVQAKRPAAGKPFSPHSCGMDSEAWCFR